MKTRDLLSTTGKSEARDREVGTWHIELDTSKTKNLLPSGMSIKISVFASGVDREEATQSLLSEIDLLLKNGAANWSAWNGTARYLDDRRPAGGPRRASRR
jgi:hypothetical protein